jgi:hypothetical protein
MCDLQIGLRFPAWVGGCSLIHGDQTDIGKQAPSNPVDIGGSCPVSKGTVDEEYAGNEFHAASRDGA